MPIPLQPRDPIGLGARPEASDLNPELRIPDPFGSISDPNHYVPRRDTEQALAALERGVRGGMTPVVLAGPAGMGKTMLLRVLTARLLDDFLAVYVPHAAFDEEEIFPWILGLMEQPLGDSAERSMVRLARRFERAGSALVLLVDDAECMPPASLGRLTGLVSEAAPALRLVLAAHDEARLAERLALPVETVQLGAAMSREEVDRYIDAHLLRSDLAIDLRECLDATEREDVHCSAHGVPRLVSRYASERLFGFRGDPLGSPEESETAAASAPEAAEADADLPGSDSTPLGAAVAAAGVRDRATRSPRATRSVGIVAASVAAGALLGLLAWRLWPTGWPAIGPVHGSSRPAVSAPPPEPVADDAVNAAPQPTLAAEP